MYNFWLYNYSNKNVLTYHSLCLEDFTIIVGPQIVAFYSIVSVLQLYALVDFLCVYNFPDVMLNRFCVAPNSFVSSHFRFSSKVLYSRIKECVPNQVQAWHTKFIRKFNNMSMLCQKFPDKIATNKCKYPMANFYGTSRNAENAFERQEKCVEFAFWFGKMCVEKHIKEIGRAYRILTHLLRSWINANIENEQNLRFNNVMMKENWFSDFCSSILHFFSAY